MFRTEELYVVMYVYNGDVSLVSAHRDFDKAEKEMDFRNSKEAGDDGEFVIDVACHVIDEEV